MKTIALLAAIMMTTMITFAQCSEAKAQSEENENIYVSVITDYDHEVIIEADMNKVEAIIASINIKSNVFKVLDKSISGNNATASGSGFKFMNDYYKNAPAEKMDCCSFVETKKSISTAGTESFTFMGDTYQEMPEEQLNLNIIPEKNTMNGSFYFMGDKYPELPEERNDLPQEEEKEGVFYFMGDAYQELPSEADQPIL